MVEVAINKMGLSNRIIIIFLSNAIKRIPSKKREKEYKKLKNFIRESSIFDGKRKKLYKEINLIKNK